MLFDRYAKLKKAIPSGVVHTGLKQIMPLLQGTLDKTDPPDVVVEPANLDELCRVIAFAGEKNLRVALAGGLSQVSVGNLGAQMLVLTSRFNGPPSYSESRASMRVDAGMSVETLAVELASHGMRWLPLHPVPAGESVGSLIATGWEGFRNWSDGGTAANIRALEWVGYDGRVYVTGSSLASSETPNVAPLLHGSRGKYGMITSVELSLKPLADARTLALFELPGPSRSVELLTMLRATRPAPEAVVCFNELSTEILRSANDGAVSDKARVLVAADWRHDVELDDEWSRYARVERNPKAANALWQDLFRLPRAAARLSPDRATARLRLPALSLEDLEERARDLSRTYGLGVAYWGTVEGGHLHVWILQPDGEARTRRQAADLLTRLIEDAIRLGGCIVDASPVLNRNQPADLDDVTRAVEEKLLKQCDPLAMHLPLR